MGDSKKPTEQVAAVVEEALADGEVTAEEKGDVLAAVDKAEAEVASAPASEDTCTTEASVISIAEHQAQVAEFTEQISTLQSSLDEAMQGKVAVEEQLVEARDALALLTEEHSKALGRESALTEALATANGRVEELGGAQVEAVSEIVWTTANPGFVPEGCTPPPAMASAGPVRGFVPDPSEEPLPPAAGKCPYCSFQSPPGKDPKASLEAHLRSKHKDV